MSEIAALLQELADLPPDAQAERLRGQSDPDALLIDLGDEAERLAVVEVQRALRASQLVVQLADELGRARARVRARRARAQALAYSGDMQQALTICREAMQIGAEHGEQIEAARAGLASMHALGELGRYDEAIATGVQSYQTFSDFDRPDLQARADINLGVIHQNRDAPREALFHFQRASATLPPDSGQLPFFVENNSGEALLLLNEFDAAEAAFQRAAAHADAQKAPFAKALAEGNIADLHARCGRLQAALLHFERARRSWEQDQAGSHKARLLAEQAEVHAELGLSEEARRGFEAALPQLSQNGQVAERARALLGLAAVYRRTGELERATQSAEDAAREFEQLGQERAAALARLTAVGCLAASAPNDALAKLRQLTDALTERDLDRATLAVVEAAAHHGAGAHQQAIEAVDAGRAALEKLPLSTLSAELLRIRASALLALNDLKQAGQAIGEAMEHYERTRGLLAGDRTRSAFAATRADVFADAVRIFATQSAPDRAARVFAALERGRSRQLLDAQSRSGTTTDPALEPIRRELNGLYARLAELQFAGRAEAEEDAVRKRLEQGEHALADAEQRMAALAQAEVGTQPVELHDLQANLASKQTLLQYFKVDDQVKVLLVTAGGGQIVDLPLRHSALMEGVQRLRFQIARAQRPGSPAALQTRIRRDLDHELEWLGQRLIAPVIEVLSQGAVCAIVPYGPLYSIPFAGLRVDDAYFVQRHSVFTVPSASLLVHLCGRTERSSGTNACLFGFADENAPQIENEIQRVSALLPDAIRHVGPQATAARLFDEIPNANLVHIASHGHFDHRGTTRAGLRMADRWVRFGEFSDIRLAARLVILSGCETGRASVAEDDSVTGTLASLLSAGAQAVLATLWPVHDEDALEMATAFHAEFTATPDQPLAALAVVQRRAVELGRSPLAWAGHALVGQP